MAVKSGQGPGAARPSAMWVAARVLLYPWFISRVVGWPFRRVRPSLRGTRVRRLFLEAAHGFVQLTVALPVSALVSLEVLMAVDTGMRGRMPDYSLPPLDDGEAALVLPGAPSGFVRAAATGSALAGGPSDAEALVERYAPVFIQRVSDRPLWDLPLAVDFDGNPDPRDNPANGRRADAFEPVVYGELTAVTEDSFYLTYSLYHLRDHDHPLRERVSRWSHHDGDNEGLHLRVERATGQVVEAETWFHNRFLYCNRTGRSQGSEPVSARLRFEGERMIAYAQSHGHGVRCATAVDSAAVSRSLILRPALQPTAARVAPGDLQGHVATYRLQDFSEWYGYAAADVRADETVMYAERIRIGTSAGGEPLVLPQYIAGADRPVGHPARPKPMWSWDDVLDGLPVGVWHLLPSYSFALHGGQTLSHRYESNAPAAALFGLDGNELFQAYTARGSLWPRSDWKLRASRDAPRAGAFSRLVRRYVNRVFATLG